MSKLVEVKKEIAKIIVGKEEAIEKILASILAAGHILVEDVPGVGKTTMALAFAKVLNLDFKRVQFTPDVVPSDITGFSMYDRDNKTFKYIEGAIMCNFFLGDEINRTSSKTQSALLEAMQEGKVTVDGNTYEIEKPFVVMATENPVETLGTQMLPEAQLDRFMIQISLGYPSENEEIHILKSRKNIDPLEEGKNILSKEELLEAIKEVKKVGVDDKIYQYVVQLTRKTRESEYISLGVSPRGSLALISMGKAMAYLDDRDYVVPEDIVKIFKDVCRHRITLKAQARMDDKSKESILDEILRDVRARKIDEK